MSEWNCHAWLGAIGYAPEPGQAGPIGSRVTVIGKVTPLLAWLPT